MEVGLIAQAWKELEKESSTKLVRVTSNPPVFLARMLFIPLIMPVKKAFRSLSTELTSDPPKELRKLSLTAGEERSPNRGDLNKALHGLALSGHLEVVIQEKEKLHSFA